MGTLQRFAPPPPAAISRVLSTFDRVDLESFIMVAIDLLDLAEPDPDAEETGLEDSFMDHPADGPGCPVADSPTDQSAIEWHTLRGTAKRGPAPNPGHEDAEEDDEPEEDDDPAQCTEDEISTQGQSLQQGAHFGPGCEISDPGGGEHDGFEHQQMHGDVPAPCIYTLDHDPFTDKRTLLARPGPGGSVYFRVNGKLWKGEPMPQGPANSIGL